jgi:hypothetical protein
MNLRKHKLLIVGGSIELALLLAVIVFLVKFNGGYQRVSRDLKSAAERLDQLNRRAPFPSQKNVEIVEANRKALQEFLGRLQGEMREKQVETEKIEPAEFTPMIERTLRKLNARARENGTILPAKFAYAVDQYAAGQMPGLDKLPRLVIQMKTIEAVCDLLIDARVNEIVDVRRQMFERTATEENPAEAGGASRRGETTSVQSEQPIPLPAESELYSVERIETTFLARENNYWEALNALSRSKPFMIVSDVKLEHPAAMATPTALTVTPPAGAQPGAQPLVPVYRSHEDRVVGGRELIRVSVVIDVYRFSEPPAKEGAP